MHPGAVVKIEIKETPRLAAAKAAEAEARRALALAEQEEKSAFIEASGVVLGKTMVEWEDVHAKKKVTRRGVVVGLTRYGDPLVRRVLSDGRLHVSKQEVYQTGRILPDLWEEDLP